MSDYDREADNVGSATQDTGILDRQYYVGYLGILKFSEMVLSLIGFICAIASSWAVCLVAPSTAEYFKFITMACFVTTLILYLVFLLKLHKRVFKCDCINWPMMMLFYYGGIIILLFFGDLFLSLHACTSALKAGVVFGWLALIAYGVDLFFAVLAFRKERSNPSQ